MRRLLTTGVVFLSSALIDYCLSLFSMAVNALPPAHYAAWMTLLDGPCSGRVQLQAVNAAMQWYGGPVVIGVAAFIVGAIARLFRAEWLSVLVGVGAFAVVKSAMGGVIDAPSVFALFFAVVCATGGGSFGDKAVDAYRQRMHQRAVTEP